MPRYVSYKCPDCDGVFEHMHHPMDSPPPDRCKLCNAWMSEDEPPVAVFVPRAPRIRKNAHVKSVDQVYRKMEADSILRAKEAADVAGVSEIEMSHLKQTNFREPEDMREGDTAALPAPMGRVVPHPNLPQANFGGGVPSVQGYVADSGGSPELGALMGGIKARHAATARQAVVAGNMGVYRGK